MERTWEASSAIAADSWLVDCSARAVADLALVAVIFKAGVLNLTIKFSVAFVVKEAHVTETTIAKALNFNFIITSS
jgi:hypothetical protein